ncbi:hypothetical protein HanRHA438_Chr13g0605401 [Helianthus annuus]|nr:hypothetical protein HanIR_Chr13g0647061 [Helianthus annuus]KAJ0858812.1 hypothetical protein HanRHA438_Chr13g0605401 [Helianthus annuus]
MTSKQYHLRLYLHPHHHHRRHPLHPRHHLPFHHLRHRYYRLHLYSRHETSSQFDPNPVTHHRLPSHPFQFSIPDLQTRLNSIHDHDRLHPDLFLHDVAQHHR